MSSRSVVTSSRHIQPSAINHQFDKLIQDFEAVRAHLRNRVIEGGLVAAPTTPSVQASGVGNTDWNINISKVIAIVDGQGGEVAAAADYDAHSGSLLLTNGQSVEAALVLYDNSGTLTLAFVKGSAATTGDQVGPTDSAIQTAVGAANPWIKLASCTINRTGDEAVTQSFDNTVRPLLASNVDANFGDWSALAS